MSGLVEIAGARPARIEVPGAIVERMIEPADASELATLLGAATARGAGVLVVGGGSRLHWANPLRAAEVAVSTGGLSGVLEFDPEEGVLRAAAGTPLVALRRRVAEEGWELPLDAPGENATVGGVLATAATGPRGHAFGRVADAILGLEVAGADGKLTHCGGRVVKNVTGYDLAKLHCGAFGTLGVITAAWLRLRPRPAARRVFEADVGTDAADLELCRSVSGLASVRALVWQSPGAGDGAPDVARLVVELAGNEAGLARDLETLGSRLALVEASADRLDRLREARAVRAPDGIALRARVPGSRLAELARVVSAAGLAVDVDLGLAAVHARGALADAGAARALRGRAEALGGFAVFESVPEAWRGEVDSFGDMGENAALMRALKERFDPAAVLNPGRFVAGC